MKRAVWPSGSSAIAVYQLLFLNYALFILDHFHWVPAVRQLYLYHSRPVWCVRLNKRGWHEAPPGQASFCAEGQPRVGGGYLGAQAQLF